MTTAPRDSIATRETLLHRLKDCEDHASWQRFYDTYHDLIFRFALKSGLGEFEAEEVVQDTAVALARNLPEYRYDPAVCSFKTWMLNQTVWRIKSQFRKRRTQPQKLPLDDLNNGVERLSDNAAEQWQLHWEADWRNAVLAAALQRVKKEANLKDCQIFELYVLRQWPAGDVAKSLQVSVARVYLAKHRLTPLMKRHVAAFEKERF